MRDNIAFTFSVWEIQVRCYIQKSYKAGTTLEAETDDVTTADVYVYYNAEPADTLTLAGGEVSSELESSPFCQSFLNET